MVVVIEEKGGQTLESVENFDRQLELIESKVNGMEQVISQENNQLRKQRICVPPELSVRSWEFY